MTNRFLFLVSVLIAGISALAQPTRQDADSMLLALKKSKQSINRIDLLLHLAQFHIFKPGEQDKDFDSAAAYINEAKALNKSLKSSTAYGFQLLTESFLTKKKGQRDEARKIVERAVSILEAGTNKSYLGLAYYEFASYYDHYDNLQLPKKIRLVEKSIELFRQAGNTKRKARALEWLGDLYFLNDESHKAILVLQQALAAYDTIKHQAVHGVYVILGRIYHLAADYSQSLFYLLRALKTAQALGDTSMQLCNINHILGTLYVSIDRPEMAIKYAEDALEIARKHKDEDGLFFLSVNLAIKYERNGQPERGLEVLTSIPQSYMQFLTGDKKVFMGEAYLRIYLSLKQYDKVAPLIEPLLTEVEGSTIVQDRSVIRRLGATYYFHTSQFSKARACLMKNRRDTKDTSYTMTPIYDAELWYKLDSAQGDFDSAFKHLLFYQTKMDSILGENSVRQLQVLGVEYETALKEDSIKLKGKDIALLTQKNSLQQATLKRQSLLKNITIAGTIVAFIIIALLYRQYMQKQKSNKMITQKNKQLQHYLTEKEWLLKEIHHRVKNNLQIVMSLLNSQSGYIDNEPALTAIHDSQRRVQAISLIHQKLYNSENLSSIDMSFYIQELVSYLCDSFNTAKRIRFEFGIEPLELDVSQAVPLGLILNEVVTNSIKYAFPDERDGVISISFSNTSPYHYLLSISDNGIGMPAQYSSRKGSLGMTLIAGLAKDLDGQLAIENNNGTTIKISFLYDISIKRSDTLTSAYVTVN